MFKTEIIGQNVRKFSTLALCNLHEPYITPGLLHRGFNNLLVFSVILFDSIGFLRTFSLFLLVDSKIQQCLLSNLLRQISFDDIRYYPFSLCNLVCQQLPQSDPYQRFLNDQVFIF